MMGFPAMCYRRCQVTGENAATSIVYNEDHGRIEATSDATEAVLDCSTLVVSHSPLPRSLST